MGGGWVAGGQRRDVRREDTARLDRVGHIAEELDGRAERADLQNGDVSQSGVLGHATHLEHRRVGIFPIIGRGLHAVVGFAAILAVLVVVDVVEKALRAGLISDARGGVLIGLATQSTSRNILEV